MKKKIISTMLCLALMLSACSFKDEKDVPNQNANTENTIIDNTGEDKPDGKEDNKEESYIDSEGHYLYNPHLKPAKLASLYPDECWEAFHNFCDAARKGEDTFECASQEAYDFSMECAVWYCLFPAATDWISPGAPDGEVGYENGVGHIYYVIPKEEFVEKQKWLENDIEGILRDCDVKEDDTDFEKALKTFNYMAENFTYGYEMIEDPDMSVEEIENRFGVYNCFKNREAICAGFGSAYALLLLECGVEAVDISGNCDGGGHRWTIVTIDGKDYHCDTTWALKENKEDKLSLQNFMMSDADRIDETFNLNEIDNFIIFYTIDNYDYSTFKCTDDKYSMFRGSTLESFNPEENKLTYKTKTGEIEEYTY